MTKIVVGVCLIFSMAFVTTASAGTETIVPEDTVTGQNNWSANAGGDKVSAVTDDIDSLYIYANGSGYIQRFVLTDETTIPADATIDSFTVVFRAQSSAASTTKIRMRVRMDGNTNYCDGDNITLSTGWVDYSETYTATPTGSGVCAGSLTKSRIDSLNVQVLSILVPIANEARVTDIDLIVYFTESGTSPITHRRRKLILISKREDNIYDTFFATVGLGSIAFDNIVKPQLWLWNSQQ